MTDAKTIQTAVIYVQDYGEASQCVGVVDGTFDQIKYLAKGYNCLERHKELAAIGKAPVVTFRIDFNYYDLKGKLLSSARKRRSS